MLGEKLHYYCSSSEDEDEGGIQRVDPSQDPPPLQQPALDGNTGNTGPKGVIKVWIKFSVYYFKDCGNYILNFKFLNFLPIYKSFVWYLTRHKN